MLSWTFEATIYIPFHCLVLRPVHFPKFNSYFLCEKVPILHTNKSVAILNHPKTSKTNCDFLLLMLGISSPNPLMTTTSVSLFRKS